MTKKMAGCYEIGLYWFQIAWQNSYALNEVLMFKNKLNRDKVHFILLSCKNKSMKHYF